jgi:hypothetical protein
MIGIARSSKISVPMGAKLAVNSLAFPYSERARKPRPFKAGMNGSSFEGG